MRRHKPFGALPSLGPLLFLALLVPMLTGCGAIAPAVSETSSQTASEQGALVQESTTLLLTDGESMAIADRRLDTSSHGEHGAVVTQAATLTLENVDIATTGRMAIPLAAIQSQAAISATGGSAVSSGLGSPCLYAAGVITLNGGVYESLRSEAAIVEEGGSLTLTDTALSTKSGDSGIMVYGTTSAGSPSAGGSVTASGGSLVSADRHGPFVYVTNATATITLRGVNVTSLSGTLVMAAADRWGAPGANGGHAVLIAEEQSLTGNLIADSLSTLNLTLRSRSSLTGAINPEGTAAEAHLTIEPGSTWKVTADSYLTSLTILGGISDDTLSCINGGGHTIYYDASSPLNQALAGKTYKLQGGGSLTPYPSGTDLLTP